MKISIITVSYNSAATIEDTIKSVAYQTYNNIEYIVVDGCSIDSTMDIVHNYSDIVTKAVSAKDKGLYDAMNKGISMATGEVIGFINSDDLFCDNFALEKVMNFFEKYDVDSVYADIFYVSKDNVNNIVRKWVSGEQKSFISGWHPAHPTFYVKKNVYDRFGGFDLDFKLGSDFEIMLRFLEKHKISTKYLSEPLVKMRLGGETNKNLENIFKQNLECIKAFEKNNIKINKFLYPFKRLIPKLFQY